MNTLLYGVFITNYAKENGKDYTYSSDLELISQGLSEGGDGLVLSPEGMAVLKARYVFAMELSPEGDVLWSYDLPRRR